MSSPVRRRGRSSNQPTASPSSVRTREPPSSPTHQATTPRAAGRLAAQGNVPSSSPMFFQSSPSRSNRGEKPLTCAWVKPARLLMMATGHPERVEECEVRQSISAD
ncbi:DNA replication licensing factor Mcm4 [Penicillium chermesinum]|uniref:DNA replication licensing factor Mcm4 n=1 Tax=Penicillium chermesinum TaxID=63820 RepID=A0A9W9P5Q6_9EURO|nr:DNA replication licensing factor Mcm4 [Penicillium chermesinum]KAJ5238411.1 DNA replication licensing factor Mcm4 [Penicillium chermesinum]